MEKLPALLSIPHAGSIIPDELKDRTSLTQADILQDGSYLTELLFDFKEDVIASIQSSIARVFIDLDRPPHELPPEFLDGVIKQVTGKKKPVYKPGCGPDEKLTEILLKNYYHPYHAKLDDWQKKQGVRIAFDCHTMLPSDISDTGMAIRKPAICLSNNGDLNGEKTARQNHPTCDAKTIQLMAECFIVEFELDDKEVGINQPTKGGHIIRTHYNGQIPWIQITVNRKLFLPATTRRKDVGHYTNGQILGIRAKILRTLRLFFLNF